LYQMQLHPYWDAIDGGLVLSNDTY
jgi:hypothetical protein